MCALDAYCARLGERIVNALALLTFAKSSAMSPAKWGSEINASLAGINKMKREKFEINHRRNRISVFSFANHVVVSRQRLLARLR